MKTYAIKCTYGVYVHTLGTENSSSRDNLASFSDSMRLGSWFIQVTSIFWLGISSAAKWRTALLLVPWRHLAKDIIEHKLYESYWLLRISSTVIQHRIPNWRLGVGHLQHWINIIYPSIIYSNRPDVLYLYTMSRIIWVGTTDPDDPPEADDKGKNEFNHLLWSPRNMPWSVIIPYRRHCRYS